jgi:hypothetical protein
LPAASALVLYERHLAEDKCSRGQSGDRKLNVGRDEALTMYRGEARNENLRPRLEHGDDWKWKQLDSKIWT